MAYALGDIYIGNYPVTQGFGADEATYKARYGLKGHNGIDIGCPSLTLILCAADGWVMELGNDTGGYGNYVKIVHDGYLTLYGHLNDIAVKKGDRLIAGQLVGHSNNTGFSTAPHLHFGVAPCDVNGIKMLSDNGFSGYIDPRSVDCVWTITNPKAPLVPGQTELTQMTSVPAADYVRTVTQGTNYKVIAQFLISMGVNNYLSVNGLPLLDLQNNPGDTTAGENIVTYLQTVYGELSVLKNTPHPPPTPESVVDEAVAQLATMPEDKKNSFLSTILQGVKNFIFTAK